MTTHAAVTKDIHRADYAALDLLRGVELETVEGILKNCTLCELRSGEVLASPGKPDHRLYGVIEGRLSIRTTRDGGVVRFVEAGDCVGEAAVLDHKPYVHFVVAETATRLFAIDEAHFLELINASHTAACNFILRLTTGMRRADGSDEGVQLRKQYQRAAHTDQLTGLHHQRAFEEILGRQMMRSAMDHKPLSLAILDIDKLEEVNRQFGTLAGDQAIYSVAEVLRRDCRPTDIIARLGGDRFAVLLPDTDIEGALVAADHIREAIAHTSIVIPNECILPPVTVAIGVVQLGAFVAAERLVVDAAAALARAQAMGANHVSR